MEGQAIIHQARLKGKMVLTEFEAKELMAVWGMPVTPHRLTYTQDQAAQAAQELGFPVVMKIVSPDIIHKSDAGCVQVNIRSQQEAVGAYQQIIANAERFHPGAVVEGVSVASMVTDGQEVFVGMKKDAVFGPVILLGLGGVLVEIFKDTSIRTLPITGTDFREMIDELISAPLLKGYRGRKHADLEALEGVVLRLSDLAAANPQVQEIDLNPVFVLGEGQGAVIADARVILNETSAEGLPKNLEYQFDSGDFDDTMRSISMLLNPQSVAIIGASQDANKLGGRVINYMQRHGYKGTIVPVNPGTKEMWGIKCYPHINQVPFPIDMACFLVPAGVVLKTIMECEPGKVKSAIVFSSGFGEMGEEGRKEQNKLKEEAVKRGIRFCGPNTAGIINPTSDLYASFSMCLETEEIPRGKIAFISQSGALGGSLLSRAWEQGVGFSRCIFSGNEGDLDTADYLNYLVDDPATQVITMYLEGIKNVQKFKRAALRALDKGKPIITYKSGRSKIGQMAVSSHTGYLAGESRIYDAFCQQLGIINVNYLMGIFDVALAMTPQSLPDGKRVAVVSTSGGACGIVADECIANGLEVPALTPQTQKRISEIIPPYGAWRNPVDVTGQVIPDPALYRETLKIVSGDPNIDIILIMLTTSAEPLAERLARDVVEVLENERKPVVICWTVAQSLAPRGMQYLRDHEIPVYFTPENAVAAVKALVQYGSFQRNRR